MTHGSQALSHFPLGRSLHGSRQSYNRRYRGTDVRSLVERTWQVVALTPCPAADVKRISSSPHHYIAGRAILSRCKVRQGVT
jgi:hypothetical protein